MRLVGVHLPGGCDQSARRLASTANSFLDVLLGAVRPVRDDAGPAEDVIGGGHRKNALFYLTEKGAQVGDLYMSLIYTCELCGVNPFDYLT